MLKYFTSIVLTGLLAFIAGLYLPWWGIGVAAFASAMIIPQKPFYAFLSGFIGIFLLWEILAWWVDSKNNGILSQKIAQILPLGGSTVLLILVTSLIGAIIGGLSALTASYMRGTRS